MSKNIPETNSPEEVDIGQLFKIIGNGLEKFFNFLGGILHKAFLGFVWLVFFLKKHFLKIGIAGIIGFGLAFVSEKVSEPVYSTSAIVQQNYNTGESLYELITRYNSLIRNNDTLNLRQALSLDENKAIDIVRIEIEPAISENLKIKGYDNYIKGLDSVLASTIDYDAYLSNTKAYDYKFQKISLRSKQANNLSVIFDELIDRVNETEFFKREQRKDLEQLDNRELAIKQSLTISDSLQSTYRKVLEKPLDRENGQGQASTVTIEGSNNVRETKEFELYQNDLELRRELVQIQRERQDKSEIIEIISIEFDNGVIDDSVEVLGMEISRKIFYALAFAFLVVLWLMSVEFLKYLEKYKNVA